MSAGLARALGDSKLDDFRLLCKLGEGTFSVVLKVKNKKDGNSYAMKRFRKPFQSAEEVESLREIQALKRLNPHPHIIDLQDIIFEPKHGILSLTFELMECNLYELISKKNSVVTEDKARGYMWQICRALEFVHGKGIFHRDIKPENILFKDGNIKIADFGSCRGIHSKQPFTEYIATRWYRSPECLLCDGMYNYKMDVWGAGCVLFEIVSRNPLFPGADELDQLHKIHAVLGTPNQRTLRHMLGNRMTQLKYNFPQKEGTGIRSLVPQMSKECVDLIVAMLSYNPDERITCKEALRHEFFKGYEGSMTSLTDRSLPRKASSKKKPTDAAPTQAISEAVTKYASNPYLKIAQPVDVDKVNAPVAAAPQQQPSHHTSKHESQQQPQPAAPQKQQSIKEDVHKSDSTTENNSLQQKQQQNTINRKKVVEQGHAVEITASTKNPSPLSDLAVSDSSVPQAASTTVTALSSTQEQQHTSVKTITDSGKATEVSTGDASGVKQVHAPSKHEEASETPAIAAASTSTAAPLHRNSIVKKTPDVQNQQPSSTLTRHPEHAPSYKLDASYPPSKDDYYKAMHQQPPPPQAVQQQQIQQQQKFPVLSTANNQDTRTLKKQPRQASSPPSVSIPPIVNKFTSAANTSTVINILQKSQNPIYVYSNNNNNNNNHHHADAKLPNLHQQQQDANGGATHNFSSYHSAQNALRLQIKDKMVAAASNNNASSSINDLNNGSNGDVSGGAARRRRKRHGSPGPVNAAANGGGAFMANIRKQAAEAAGFGVWSNDLGIIGKQAQVTISSKTSQLPYLNAASNLNSHQQQSLSTKAMQQKNNNTIPFIAQQQKFAAAALQSSFDTAPKNPMKMAQKDYSLLPSLGDAVAVKQKVKRAGSNGNLQQKAIINANPALPSIKSNKPK